VLRDATGKEVGKARLTVNPSGVVVSLDLTAVPPGEHAFHIHAFGKCEPPDFKSQKLPSADTLEIIGPGLCPHTLAHKSAISFRRNLK
jgi:Cu/Zn superoxide dismutase